MLQPLYLLLACEQGISHQSLQHQWLKPQGQFHSRALGELWPIPAPRIAGALRRHSSRGLPRQAFSTWLLADRSVSLLGSLSRFTTEAGFQRIGPAPPLPARMTRR